MSLDIRRLKINPYKKLEKPTTEQSHLRYQIAALLESLSASLAVLAAFLIPAWWYDFGAGAGSVQRLVLIITLGLLAVLVVLARVLAAKPGGKLTIAERLLGGLAILLILGALFGANWRTALGLNQTGSAPYLPELILLFVWAGLIARWSQREKYAKLVLAGLMLGSTVFALSIAARYFIFSNRGLLITLAAQSWPAVLAVTAFLILVFAWRQSGWARAIWFFALAAHLAVIGLFFSVEYFGALSPAPAKPYAPAILAQAVKSNFGLRSFLPAGPAAAAGALAQSAVADTEINFDNLQKGVSLPPRPLVANSYIQLYFQLGIIGAFLWVAFWLLFLRNSYVFLRGHRQSKDESVYLGTVALTAVAILLGAMAFTPWSLPLAWLLFTLVGVAMALRDEAADVKTSFLSEIWERVREKLKAKNMAPWLNGAGVVLVVVLYIALAVVSNRVVGAERAAAGADVAAVGVRYNHWERAAQKNPWNDFYKLKMAQSRLDVISDTTPISDQRDTFEAVNKTLLQTAVNNDPVFPWLSALVYAQMEKYVEGSAKLGQGAYSHAYKLWPNNVALGTQIAKFYREQTDKLVSSEVTASQLRSEAKDYIKQALKLDNGYLPAHLELALLIEQDGDLPGAVAELEQWENTSPEIKYHLGRLYFNDNQTDAAVEKFLQVIKEVPNHSNAHYSLGVAYYRLNKYSEALTEFEAVDKLNPGNADVVAKIEEVRKKVK